MMKLVFLLHDNLHWLAALRHTLVTRVQVLGPAHRQFACMSKMEVYAYYSTIPSTEITLPVNMTIGIAASQVTLCGE